MQDKARFEYTVRSCDIDDIQELESILNEMSLEGWELYSLNEVETEEGDYSYLCIFSREKEEFHEFEDDYIVDSGDFKTRMKKLLRKKEDLYEECRFLQREIREQSQKIMQIKQSLDSNPEETTREELNKNLSEKINELNILKSKFSEILSPSNMYTRINQDLITIAVSYEHSELVDNEKNGDLIAESVRLRQKLTDELGYVIPRVHFVISEEMNENEYKIKIRNLTAVSGIAYSNHRRFFMGESNIHSLPEQAVEDTDPVSGQEVFWLKEDKTRDFWERGMTPSQVITSHLETVVLKYAEEIIGYENILNYIALLEEEKSFLADDLIHGGLSLGDLRYIFANLIKERVSVKDITYIFERLNDLSKHEYEAGELLKELRIRLARQICSQIADSNNVIYAITLPEQYKKLLKNISASGNKYKSSGETEKFIKHVSGLIQTNDYNTSQIAFITDPEYRQAAFFVLQDIGQVIPVISYDEVSEEFSIQEI